MTRKIIIKSMQIAVVLLIVTSSIVNIRAEKKRNAEHVNIEQTEERAQECVC